MIQRIETALTLALLNIQVVSKKQGASFGLLPMLPGLVFS